MTNFYSLACKKAMLEHLHPNLSLPCFGGRLTVEDILVAAIESEDADEACEKLKIKRGAYYLVLRNIIPGTNPKITWRNRLMQRTPYEYHNGYYYKKPVQLELFPVEDNLTSE